MIVDSEFTFSHHHLTLTHGALLPGVAHTSTPVSRTLNIICEQTVIGALLTGTAEGRGRGRCDLLDYNGRQLADYTNTDAALLPGVAHTSTPVSRTLSIICEQTVIGALLTGTAGGQGLGDCR